jgi:hypothetical protein
MAFAGRHTLPLTNFHVTEFQWHVPACHQEDTMSQAAVEQVLGRMITDERFRCLATTTLEAACLQD